MIDKLIEISKLKEKFIEQRKEVLASKISDAQKLLYNQLFDKVISLLDTEAGSIVNNAANVALINKVDKIFNDFQLALSGLMSDVVSDYRSILGMNVDYFTNFNNALFNSVESTVTDAMMARAGFNSKGFDKNGFIDSFIKDTTVARTVKQSVLSGVLNGTPMKQLIKGLQATITGTADSAGLVENQFKTYVYDTYSQFDRETSNQFSIQLDLNYGIYTGGLVAHSRPFCIERNGKVFTRAEIHAFGTPQDKYGGYIDKSKGDFAGKWSKAQGIVYVPERDLGCNRCGHTLMWVDYTIAKSIRSDIPKYNAAA